MLLMCVIIFICLILALSAEVLSAEQSILERSPVKTIYLVQFAHLDIGFTDTQAVVAKRSSETIDSAIELCAKDPDYKWTIESLWQLEQWMNGKSADEIGRLISLIKLGRMSLTACHSGLLSALLGPEEACRHLYLAEKFRKQYGVEIVTAMQNDIPGYSWSYPQVLAGSGINYFVTGINTFIGAGARISVKDNPFYWEGPDGSRVLVCICSDPEADHGGYILARWGYGWTKGGRAEQTVPEFLERLEKQGYRYDSILVPGSTGDNERTDLQLVEGVREWNAKHSTPKMVISTPEEFFRHMESKYGKQFPVFRGDWSGIWDQNASGLPFGMGMNRQAKNLLYTGEALAAFDAVLGLSAYPKQRIDRAWSDITTYDEHSGGGVWPDMFTPEQAYEEAKTKIETARSAFSSAKNLHDGALSALVSNVSMPEDGIVVWNSLPAKRSGIVRVKLDDKWFIRSFELFDVICGKPTPYQKCKETKELLFSAVDVPGLGYKTFSLKQTADPKQFVERIRVEERSLENDFVRLELDSDGNIVSLLDKRAKREIVDGNARFKFGQLVKADNKQFANGNCEVVASGGCFIRIGQRGPVAASLIVTRKDSPLAKTEITLYADSPAVHFRHVFDRSRTPHAGAGVRIAYDVAYPIDLPDSRLVFDTAAGPLDPLKDRMPGASPEVLVQNGGYIANMDGGIAFSSKQSMRWEFEHIHGAHGGKLPPETTLLMMRLLDKHDTAKYKGGAGEYCNEPGRPDCLVFENAFLPYECATNCRPEAMEFLESEAVPLAALFAPATGIGKLPSKTGRMLRIDGLSYRLLCFKQSESGDGYVLRLMEVDGRSTSLSLKSELLAIRTAVLLDSVERPVAPLQVKNGNVELKLQPRQIVTVKLSLTKSK